ncbi:hypothetical protein [Nonomuraea sp. NPDC049625]|uniref:hypothetical protein n=1 Tax=Nonomuraea sp. NPDC049625 TaxID=3155775 RepID=UPI003427DDF9
MSMSAKPSMAIRPSTPSWVVGTLRRRATDGDRLDAHRELLEGVAASWPDDAPYMAEEVRRILAGEDD